MWWGRLRLLSRLAVSLAVLAQCLAQRAPSRPQAGSGRVVQLTELNFDETVDNGKPWMIAMNAHYCPLTRELESVFDRIARQLHPDVCVGKVDGSVERGLLSRFQLRSLHGVFHLNGTETRAYCDGHGCEGAQLSTKQLIKYAKGGWKAEAPRTGCTSPVSRCGRAMGELTKLPAKAKRTYLYLHSERQYSDLTLFGAMLAVPVVVGLSLICFLDAYYSRRPAHLPPLHVHHQHFD